MILDSYLKKSIYFYGLLLNTSPMDALYIDHWTTSMWYTLFRAAEAGEL